MKVDTIIFDGSHAAHRISAATPPLNNSKGVRVEVVFGLLRLLSSVIRANPASKCTVVWDGTGCKDIRRAIFPGYKQRDADKDDGTKERIQSMHEQLRLFWEQFGQFLPIHWASSHKFEADDIIAMAARQEARSDHSVLVVSGDKDLLQIVSNDITVYSPFGDKYCTLDNFAEYTGGFPTPLSWLYAKCLMGDSSDKVPGIGGVQDKTALKILQAVNWEIGPLKYGHCPGITGKLMERIKHPDTWAAIARNYKLMSLCGPIHHCASNSSIDIKEGVMNGKQLQMNLAKNQFATLLASFTIFINPFRLLER
jgi:DNA polymerase-1